MDKVILHIPHSSVDIPIYDGYQLSDNQIEKEQLLLTDWHTDDLFVHDNSISVIAPFSRLFCDVERFADDSMEPMSLVGMGVLYTTLDDGSPMRVLTPELRKKILTEYYYPHHERLTNAVQQCLNLYGRALIIDCHSFPDVPLRRDICQKEVRPDYNLGTDRFHTSDALLQIAEEFFSERNLTVGINSPYSGSIVPLDYYQKDKRVQSLMLEVNRRLYLLSNTNIKSPNYNDVKAVVKDFIRRIIC